MTLNHLELLSDIFNDTASRGLSATADRTSCFRHYIVRHIGHSPAYISDLLTSTADVPGRPALRTASRGDFIVPRTNRKFGDREFCVAAPRVWNRLPADLRQLRSTQTFRRHLKTFLFAASY